MSILQFDPGAVGSNPVAESAFEASSLSSTGIVLRSVHELLDRWKDEFVRFDFKLKEKLDPLIHLAELTVLPCAYACYQANASLVEVAPEKFVPTCPLGVSSREDKRSRFRFHTEAELRDRDLSEEMSRLRSEILDVFLEARIDPQKGHYTRDGYSDLGFLAGTLIFELTEGELLPVGKSLKKDNPYSVVEWDVIEARWLYPSTESSAPSISKLYSFLWRGVEFAHLQDPISSVSAFADRLQFNSTRVGSDAVVVWEPETLISPDISFSQPSVAGLLIEKNCRDENFRPLLVTWLHHTERGTRYGKELGLIP